MKLRTFTPAAGLILAAALLTGCVPSDADATTSGSSSAKGPSNEGSRVPAEPAVDGLSVDDFPVVSGDVISDTGQDGNHTVVVSTVGNVVVEDAVAKLEAAGYTIDSSTSNAVGGKITASGSEYSAMVVIAGATATYVFTAS